MECMNGESDECGQCMNTMDCGVNCDRGECTCTMIKMPMDMSSSTSCDRGWDQGSCLCMKECTKGCTAGECTCLVQCDDMEQPRDNPCEKGKLCSCRPMTCGMMCDKGLCSCMKMTDTSADQETKMPMVDMKDCPADSSSAVCEEKASVSEQKFTSDLFDCVTLNFRLAMRVLQWVETTRAFRESGDQFHKLAVNFIQALHTYRVKMAAMEKAAALVKADAGN